MSQIEPISGFAKVMALSNFVWRADFVQVGLVRAATTLTQAL